MKANPALGVVAHMASLGLGADVASAGELATALRAGIAADRIVMTGPGKRDDELLAAVRAGIRAVTVESPNELASAGDDRRPRGAGASRSCSGAAVSAAATLERVRLVGDNGAGKFGMDARDLLACAEHAAGSRHLDLLGLHLFGASNVLDAVAVGDHIEATVAAARRARPGLRRLAPPGRRRRRAGHPVRVT